MDNPKCAYEIKKLNPEGTPRVRQKHNMLQTLVISCWLVVLSLIPALAQTVDAGTISEIARVAFFHVTVTGTPIGGGALTRQGKAFAVGENLLVTSEHIVGGPADWQPKDGAPKEITLSIRPLNRDVVLQRATGAEQPPELKFPIVIPAPAYALDAAGISLPNLKLERHFKLTMCEITAEQNYTAIMTTDQDPMSPQSVDKVEPIKIKAVGYDPERYGLLYVFDTVGAERFVGDPEGHDGSPILDSEGNVVAVISAVTTFGAAHRILATPIQPLFPATSALLARAPDANIEADDNLKCSLSATVRRIHDQVAKHAIWTLTVGRENDGRPQDNLHLSYESVADPPNVASVRIDYEFWGQERKDRPVTRISFRNSKEDFVEILQPTKDDLRAFDTSGIVSVGKMLVEPFVKPNNGSIQYVKLYIYPTLKNGQQLSAYTYRDFHWRQETNDAQ